MSHVLPSPGPTVTLKCSVVVVYVGSAAVAEGLLATTSPEASVIAQAKTA